MNATNISNDHIWCVLEEEEDRFMDLLLTYYKTVNIILAVVGLVTNSVTFAAQLKWPKLRKGSYVFLMSSTVAYIVLSLMDIMIASVYIKNRTSVVTVTLIVLWSFKWTSSGIIAWNVLAMAVDKFISLFWPLRYDSLITPRTRYVIITCIICGGTLSAVMISTNSVAIGSVCIGDYPSDTNSEQFGMLAFVLIVVVVIVLYARVLHLAVKQRKAISELGADGAPKSAKRGSHLILAVMTSFVVCYVPYQVYLNISRLVQVDEKAHAFCMVLFIHFMAVNYFLDNLLYGVLNKDYRNAYKQILSMIMKSCCHSTD
ncbi:hypothetical protein CAPTEDRAFT_215473 [Capitella teleta]|uniref:G-protein coupled receptors family 1 profile domain-containing protein n=1 Tax=Capitella teleta TaxID=283909 RepID=R7TZE1_CAPTE|nr:hypothetical protein CAPTEDRAFT_215473 [Capitella teleta]|eukprot:ELT99139.1 hypothetical protein CAPTEDRAFT_215473 [Capitella teleta]